MSSTCKAEIVGNNLILNFSSGLEVVRKLDVMPKLCKEIIPDGWEEICTGCGKCCYYRWLSLDKKVHSLELHCKHYDAKNKKCSVYKNRETTEGGCAKMAPKNMPLGMPEDCAYQQQAVKSKYGII